MRRGSLLARFKRPATPQPTTTDSDESSPDPTPTTTDSDESSPEPAPTSTGTSLVLDWEEAVELVRARRGDVFEIQFLGREVDRMRGSADPGQVAKADDARAHLREVIERKLRGKGLLAPDGHVELVDT